MEVEVHHVKAHITGTDDAHNCVEVCSIVVKETTCFVDYFADLFNVLFKKTKGGGVGEHKGCGVFTDHGSQFIKVNTLFIVGLHCHNVKSCH